MPAASSVPFADLTLTMLAQHYGWPATTGDKQRWLRVNFATSADGAVAGSGGTSRSVSGGADKLVFALLRATCDAVVVGAGTARTEGYGPVSIRTGLEQIRSTQGRTEPPTLVVVTGSANLDPASDMFSYPGTRSIVVTAQSAPERARSALAQVADVLICGEDCVDLGLMVRRLADRGCERLLCEGGPHLFTDLLHAGLVDELCLTISPLVVGAQVQTESGLVRDPGRIVAGPGLLPDAVTLTLASLIESDGTMLARYLISR